ncbi:MAG: hypothetical protein KGZ85_03555 [Ignavibacterium sp.]|nr:hypothetical protein [Ignavibacterium sp.]
MLQEYLNLQFIHTTDEVNFEKLKKTGVDVSKKISKDKAKILSYSRIAFDPEIPADNNEIVEIQRQIIENWQTFIPTTKDTSITIIRAVMLEALETISKELSSACLIWFATRNVIKHFKLGREKEMLSSFLLKLGNRIEEEVSEKWNFDPDYDIDTPKVVSATIDENDLAAGITAATVKDAVNKAFKKQVNELKENQKNFANQVSLMQMRTQLLWWKEASYSPSKKEPYNNMKDGLLQILLAYDYSDFIPELYPVSVDYFLLETHNRLSTNTDKRIKISQFLKMVEENGSELKNILPEFKSENGRISFVDFINGLIYKKFKVKQFKTFVGISDSVELLLSDITLWLFHDFHSIELSLRK